MSNFNNLNNLNPKALNALLGVASKKLNTTPEQLKKQLEDGTFDKALQGVPLQQQAMLKQALSNKATAEKILSSPQAQEIYRKLNGK